MFKVMVMCVCLMIVSGCSTTKQKGSPAVDLSGEWTMTLPAGFVSTSPIERVDDTHYRIPNIKVLSGVYQRRGNMLVVVEPIDARLTEFIWEIRDADNLVLIQSPPVGKIGSDYTGATLNRIKR